MKLTTLSAALLLLPVAVYVANPAVGQPQSDDTAADPGNEVIISGKVTSATDTDNDEKKDTFEINTGGDNKKKVVNKTETKDMGLIEVDDKVEIKCKVLADGSLQIVDVIKIGG